MNLKIKCFKCKEIIETEKYINIESLNKGKLK